MGSMLSRRRRPIRRRLSWIQYALLAWTGVVLTSGVIYGVGLHLRDPARILHTDSQLPLPATEGVLESIGRNAFLVSTVPVYMTVWVAPRFIVVTGLPALAHAVWAHLLAPMWNLVVRVATTLGSIVSAIAEWVAFLLDVLLVQPCRWLMETLWLPIEWAGRLLFHWLLVPIVQGLLHVFIWLAELCQQLALFMIDGLLVPVWSALTWCVELCFDWAVLPLWHALVAFGDAIQAIAAFIYNWLLLPLWRVVLWVIEPFVLLVRAMRSVGEFLFFSVVTPFFAFIWRGMMWLASALWSCAAFVFQPAVWLWHVVAPMLLAAFSFVTETAAAGWQSLAQAWKQMNVAASNILAAISSR